MSVIRIGEMIQPAWMRAASAFTYTNSLLPAAVRRFFSRVVIASEAALNVLPALLTPASVVALVLGVWRISSDLGWTEQFLIVNGFFSHWQVWIALAIVLQIAASSLSAKMQSDTKISEEN